MRFQRRVAARRLGHGGAQALRIKTVDPNRAVRCELLQHLSLTDKPASRIRSIPLLALLVLRLCRAEDLDSHPSAPVVTYYPAPTRPPPLNREAAEDEP